MFGYKSKYKKVGVLPIRIVKSDNVLNVGLLSDRNLFLQRNKGLSAVHKPFYIFDLRTFYFSYNLIYTTNNVETLYVSLL